MSSLPHEQEAEASVIDDDRGHFYEHFRTRSLSQQTLARFRAIRAVILRIGPVIGAHSPIDVADIGCGAGTQSLLWAEDGYNVYGADVNMPLLELACQRAAQKRYKVNFVLASAVALPWPGNAMDVCLAVELLEHLVDWRSCLTECSRVVRPGGVLFISTTNALCPFQQEFNLPFYSWYPPALKRICERLAKSTWPAIANHAKYPAVNWFTFAQLQSFLGDRGFESFDRFDLINPSEKGALARSVLFLIRRFSLVRWMAHLATPGTTVLAVKKRK